MADLFIALLYGIVQGVTEWLPVSSTGHMLLLDALLPLPVSADFRAFFLVAVQLGSLCAVPMLFRRRLNLSHRTLWARVLCAVIPAGVCGLLLDDFIDANLGTPAVIAGALIVWGGAFLLVGRRRGGIADPAAVPMGRALGIGCFQALALIPGTSRSGATILGGTLFGLDPACAAEFSFLLAMPTMLAAAGLKGAKLGLALVREEVFLSSWEWVMLAAASLAAYAVSRAAIRFLMDFVRRHGLSAFGVYRILLGGAVLAAHAAGLI